MRRTFTAFAAFALVLGMATTAGAQTIDANGKCHDAKGRMAAMSVCKPPAAAPAASMAAGPQCVKGKRCGKSCIAKDKVCHK